jgi:hypothetical protein
MKYDKTTIPIVYNVHNRSEPDLMMYDKTTLAKQFFDDNVTALNALAARFGLAQFDAVASCDGIAWLKGQIDANPGMTLDDVAGAFQTSSGDRGAWASGVLRDVGDKLYPEFRAAMLAALHGDNCTMVAKHCRNKLTSVEKDQLRRQFRAREEPSTDLETELK